MELESIVSLVTVLVAVGSLIVTLVVAVNSARKDAFEDLQKVVEQMRLEYRRLERRFRNLQRENEALQRWTGELARQIVGLGGTPITYVPPILEMIERTEWEVENGK
jgi:chaperonin cofactor prefoldin